MATVNLEHNTMLKTFQQLRTNLNKLCSTTTLVGSSLEPANKGHKATGKHSNESVETIINTTLFTVSSRSLNELHAFSTVIMAANVVE